MPSERGPRLFCSSYVASWWCCIFCLNSTEAQAVLWEGGWLESWTLFALRFVLIDQVQADCSNPGTGSGPGSGSGAALCQHPPASWPEWCAVHQHQTSPSVQTDGWRRGQHWVHSCEVERSLNQLSHIQTERKQVRNKSFSFHLCKMTETIFVDNPAQSSKTSWTFDDWFCSVWSFKHWKEQQRFYSCKSQTGLLTNRIIMKW